MLDNRDHSIIKFKRVNATSSKEVDFKNIVKGYKINDDYIILEPGDFEMADPKKT